jgi:hypothetical protein
MSELGRLIAAKILAQQKTDPAAPRRFRLISKNEDGPHTYTSVMAYGVMWGDSSVTVHGCNLGSTAHFKELDDLYRVHGSGDYELCVEWIDG